MEERLKSRRDSHAQARAEILQVAARFIARHGYFGMTMRALARQRGKALASFYNHFSSKEDVLFALQTGAFQALIACARDGVALGVTAEGRLHAFILNHVTYVAENPDIMRVLVHEAGALPPRRRRVVRELKETYFGMARQIISELMHSERLPADDAEVDRSTYALFGMINWVWSWYRPRRHGSPREVARTLHRILLAGLIDHDPFRAVQEDVERRMTSVRRAPLIPVEIHGGP
ncbi:MAG: TetR/AcrR family transcriptional regulator [Myxococcota bacterium]